MAVRGVGLGRVVDTIVDEFDVVFDKLNKRFLISKWNLIKNQIFTQVVYVNLQVFEEIVDDIVIQIQLNHLNNVNDDSKT